MNARTEWGDTPAHYAAQYSCYEVLRQLIEKGAEVDKPANCKFINYFYSMWTKTFYKPKPFTITLCSFCIVDLKSYNDLFEKHSIPEEEADMWQSTLLQKAAKSTCIVKNTYLLGKVMDAKKKNSMNLYFSK